jgi:hypothetical protein
VGSATAFRLTFASNAAAQNTIGPVLPTNAQNYHALHIRPIIIGVLGVTGNWEAEFTCTGGFLFRNGSGTLSLTSITCSLTVATGGAPAFGTVPTVTLDAGNTGINITVTPPAGNTDTISANAWVETMYH